VREKSERVFFRHPDAAILGKPQGGEDYLAEVGGEGRGELERGRASSFRRNEGRRSRLRVGRFLPQEGKR